MFTFYGVQATGGAAQLEASDPTTAQGGCTGALCHPALSHLRSPHPSASWSPQSRGQALSPPARLRSAPSQVRSPRLFPAASSAPIHFSLGPPSLTLPSRPSSMPPPPGSRPDLSSPSAHASRAAQLSGQEAPWDWHGRGSPPSS